MNNKQLGELIAHILLIVVTGVILTVTYSCAIDDAKQERARQESKSYD